MIDTKISLKALRINANMTQEEVAKFIGVATSTYKLYEADSDRVPFGIIKRLAEYYKVSLDVIA